MHSLVSGGHQSPLSHTPSIVWPFPIGVVYSNAGRFEEPAGLKTTRINASHPQLIAAGVLTNC